MNQLVSVVIPVYRGGEYIEKTVKTILSQDYSNIELLLINDGCPDNSGIILDELATTDKRIRVFHKDNGGVAEARNFGIKLARGELIAFCDQDDLWLPSKLSKQMPLFDKQKVGVVYCGAESAYLLENKIVSSTFDKRCRGDVFDILIYENKITCCTVIARKFLLENNNAFDAENSLMGVDDWLAWLKLSLVCDFDFVSEDLAVHVFHGDNYSSNEEKMHAAELVCLNKIEPMAKKHNKLVDWDEIKQNLHVRYANTYIYNGMFNLAGDTFLKAYRLKNNGKLLLKGRLLKVVPNFIWQTVQKIKRKL
ncbi:MAG: glycosyltransferase involved in cell wall biosynthesis [Cognaticolwellia sp.]|jgi:glycosyltransferase involved in cell wall biosynthesis